MCFACKPSVGWLVHGWRLFVSLLFLANIALILSEFDILVVQKPFIPIDFSHQKGIETFLWEKGMEREIEAVQTAILHFEPKHSLQDSKELAEVIVNLAREYQIDSYLVLSIIHVESTFKKEAVSIKGAVGLMQIKPSVAQWIAQKSGIDQIADQKSLYSPKLNIQLGILYFKYLMNVFDESLVTSLEAYNIGPKVVRSHLNENHVLPEHKAHYARKVLHTYRMIKDEQFSQLSNLD